MDPEQVEQTLRAARRCLLDARDEETGAFRGRLSTSALSTGTATLAFALAMRDARKESGGEARDEADSYESLVRHATAWLIGNQNQDGGFGDTTDSPSNLSTTTVCAAALRVAADAVGEPARIAEARASRWISEACGTPDRIDPRTLAAKVRARYGRDHTFSVPILTTCALADLLGEEGWKHVPPLPFELAAFPHQLFKWLRMRTVSYALPALIAMGQVRHAHRPSRNPCMRMLRDAVRARTLRVLERIQPSGGGYLEAAPLTSFVSMSLIAIGLRKHPVVRRGLAFLSRTVRSDGGWPIDTNLDTWTTTLATGALDAAARRIHAEDRDVTHRRIAWLLDQQHVDEHPFTRANPGGWAWTDLDGGVPDADDTPGAMLALRRLRRGIDDLTTKARIVDSARLGVTWLLDLQNRDGGIPTFCKGWGQLPFDRSSPDLTAHTIRAWDEWRDHMPPAAGARTQVAIRRAMRYLLRVQHRDGSWRPLWFGNQQILSADNDAQENPLYGTSRVLRAIAEVECDEERLEDRWRDAGRRGANWLLAAQRGDGAFVSAPDNDTTVEETAWAVEALASWRMRVATHDADRLDRALDTGVAWICRETSGGQRFIASPLGLYFAKLWYSERLYPVVFTLSALELARAAAAAREASDDAPATATDPGPAAETRRRGAGDGLAPTDGVPA